MEGFPTLIITCSICMDDIPFIQENTLVCGHTFHTSCVRAWNTRSKSCPICRSALITQENLLFETVLDCYKAIDARKVSWGGKKQVNQKLEEIISNGAHIAKSKVRLKLHRGKMLFVGLAYCHYANDFAFTGESAGAEIRCGGKVVREAPFFVAAEYAYYLWHPDVQTISFTCTIYRFSSSLLAILRQHRIFFKDQTTFEGNLYSSQVPEKSAFVPRDKADWLRCKISEEELDRFYTAISLSHIGSIDSRAAKQA